MELETPTPAAAVRQELEAAYAEAHRAYHTMAHVLACLEVLDSVRGHAERPAEIEVALWFHDAVYDTRRADNEARSAEWADRVLADVGATEAVRERVRSTVLATRHAAQPCAGDEALLVDVDLSILGADDAAFDAYDAAIRKEYAWVTDRDFTEGRRRVLRGFLDRAHIFATPPMRARYEGPARRNLARSLERLG